VTGGPAERHLRTAQAMREGLAPRPALRLTMEGLLVLAAAARRPVRPGELTERARAQLDILHGEGLIGNRGTVTEGAAAAARALAAPNVRLNADIGTSAGRATWSAWLGPERAVVAVRADPARDDLAVFIVPPAWAPVMAVRWLGVGPRPEAAPGSVAVVPMALLQQRLADRAVPAPPGAPAEVRALWDQPLVLWGLRADPGGFGLLVLDAARAGFWLASVEGAQTGAKEDQAAARAGEAGAQAGQARACGDAPATTSGVAPGSFAPGDTAAGDTTAAGTAAGDTAAGDIAGPGFPARGDVTLRSRSAGQVWRQVTRCVVQADVLRRGRQQSS
jgi:hypothetical protein